jgi:L-threonylcarbamoyladenylate synthase
MSLYQLNLDQAANLLKRGEVVAFPTETVYGLGARIFCVEAVQKIFHIKGRPSDNPLIAHISHLDQVLLIAQHIPHLFYYLADYFFPGPLTILLPKNNRVPSCVTANLPLIGVRMPAHPLAQQLIEAVGEPLVAPSANISGKPSSTTAHHVSNDFGDKISGILDGGACDIGIESTVITLTPKPIILRPGAVTKEELESVLKIPVQQAQAHAERPLSPGMKYRHYAPKARIILTYNRSDYDSYLPQPHRRCLTSITAQNLYSQFRQADTDGINEIIIFCSPEMQTNLALMNRLERASESSPSK